MTKDEFRKLCKNNKRFNRYYYSKIISKTLYQIAKNYSNILVFIPLDNEVDIRELIIKLRKENKKIFIPFMENLSFKMVKYRLPLYKKQFNILEPKNSNPTIEKIDLAIVPVLGIDSSFRRVGFGKGMYDRFFSKLSYRPKIVFVQLRICFSKKVITDFFDIRADEYISFKIRRKYNGYNNPINYSDSIRSRGIFCSKKN